MTALRVFLIGICLWLGNVPTGTAESQAEADTPLNITILGQGDATLYIPGLSSSPVHFKSALPDETAGASHLVHLPGFAGEPPIATNEDYVKTAAARIGAYIEDANLSGLQLVGHSMGGVIALQVAADYPDRIDAVLIVDSVPFLPALFQPGATVDTSRPQAEFMKQQMLSLSQEQFLGMMKAGLPRQAISKAAQALVYADIEASDQASIASGMYDLMSTDYSPLLETIEAKITLLVPHNAGMGASVDAIRSRYENQYSGARQLDIVIIEDSGHFIQLDQPDRFAEELTRFLEANNG